MDGTKHRNWSILVLLFFISSVAFSVLSYKTSNYCVFYDELAHNNYAKAIADGNFFEFRGEQVWYFENLYSIIISPVFMFIKDGVLAHNVIMLINSIMMSSAIFPIYMIASRLLRDKRLMWLAVLYGLLIPERIYSSSVMQEALNYPLMMWFFCLFVYVIYSKKDRVVYPISLSLLSVLLTIVKQMNLAVVLAVVFYYFYCILIYKEKRARYIRDMLVYCILYLLLKNFYTFIVHSMVDVQSTGRSLFDFLYAIDGIQTILILGYGFAVYVVGTLLATGIFQIPILACNINKVQRKSRDLIVFIFLYLIIYIGTICLKIVLFEDYAQESIRIHLRYYFYGFVLLFIIFLNWYEQCKGEVKNNSQWIAIYSLLFIVGILPLIDIIPRINGGADNVSLNYLALFSGQELLLSVLKICIISVILVGIILIHKHKYKALLVFTVIYMAGTSLIGVSANVRSRYIYTQSANVQQQTQDAVKLNNYWEEEGLPTDDASLLCIIGSADNVVSEAVFECYLIPQYHYIQESYLLQQWKDIGQIDFSSIQYLTLNAYEVNENMTTPQYLIVRKSSAMMLSGYEPTTLEMEQYVLYHKVSENVSIQCYIEGVSSDQWVSNDAIIYYNGTQDGTITTLLLELDNTLFSHPVSISYTDGKGNTGVLDVPNNGDSLTVDIEVEKTDTGIFELALHTDDAIQPDSETDDRFLSFRLLNVKVEKNDMQ